MSEEDATKTTEDSAANGGCSPVPCSAADLLRGEAERIGGVRDSKPIHADLRWAYSVAAAWLDCRNDPLTIHKWQEIPEQNDEIQPPKL